MDVRPPEEWRRRKLPLRCTVCGREMPGEHWRRRGVVNAAADEEG
jgi:hypothetical protein